MSNPLTQLVRDGFKILLVGPPGCAKTARVRAAADELGADLITVRLSLCERVDLSGCLVPDLQSGTTVQLPLHTLATLRAATRLTILFLDDLGQGPVDVQAGSMSLFDAGALPDCVRIVGATNRPADRAGVTSLCEPLRSRFDLAYAIATPSTEDKTDGPTLLSDWKAECDGWCDWAADQGFAPEIIAWHRSTTGRTLYDWRPHSDPAVRQADYRSWHSVCRLWQAGHRDFRTVSAVIGKGKAAEFLAFAALADQLPTLTQIWLDPDGAPVPQEPAAQYLVAAIVGRGVEPKFAEQAIRYFSRLPRVISAYCARDSYKRLGAKLAGTKAWQSWWLENKALFETS